LTKRRDGPRKTKQKQGPLPAQWLADHISKRGEEEMERLLNQMVQVLARRGMVTGKLGVALAGSKLPTPQRYEGCGKLKATRKGKVKGQKEVARED
jgi:hypothetical protein